MSHRTVAACLLVAAVALCGNSSAVAEQHLERPQLHTPASSHTSSAARRLQKKFFGDHEQMMIFQGSPEEINVDPRTTYNEKFMALMNSPCRPEVDGFFGATSGDPVRIQYGFRLEIEPLSDVMSLLDVIEDKIVDSILMNTFPKMCGLRRRRANEVTMQLDTKHGAGESRVLAPQFKGGHPSGFRFVKFDEVGNCVPQVNAVNFCGVFTGIVDVYGRHMHGDEAAKFVKAQIDKVLVTKDPQQIDKEVASLAPAEEYTSITGTAGNPIQTSSSDEGLSRVAILIIIIALMLFIAICYYIYIRWHERKVTKAIYDTDANIRPFKDYDEEDRSIHASPSLEAEEVFDGEGFDDEYSNSDVVSHVTRSSRASRSSRGGRMLDRQFSNPSLLQYSSKASSKSFDMEDLGLDSYYDDEVSKAKRNGELL